MTGTPRQASQDGPGRDDRTVPVGPGRPSSPEPSDAHTRAHHVTEAACWAEQATVTGGTTGIAYGLAAITHAILATSTQEKP